MSNQHYPEEFKIQAVNQVTEKNFFRRSVKN
jgi:transposase-like protein